MKTLNCATVIASLTLALGTLAVHPASAAPAVDHLTLNPASISGSNASHVDAVPVHMASLTVTESEQQQQQQQQQQKSLAASASSGSENDPYSDTGFVV
jgi:hypothetical protein